LGYPDKQTNKQTNKQIDKRRAEHILPGGGKNALARLIEPMTFASLAAIHARPTELIGNDIYRFSVLTSFDLLLSRS